MNNAWTIQSLFSGIGGLDLGVERALGAQTVAFCEFAEQNRAILRKNFPGVTITNDVCETSGLSGVDVITAGFPCQDASKANPKGQAGTKGQKTGLWFETLRIIQEASPKLVVLENVRNLLNCGFEDVVEGLDAAGYDVRWGVWTVAAVGGPHIRERLITLALRRDVDPSEVPLQEAGSNPWARGFAELPPQTLDPRYGYERMTTHEWEAEHSRRLFACGNAVCPEVATQALLQTLPVWNEFGGELELSKKGKLPAWGAAVAGEFAAVEALVKPASLKRDFGRGDWVRWRMRADNNELFRPMIGRVHYANGDNTDIEMPGGDVDVVNTEDVKRWWPTPTAHDEKNTGCQSEYNRNSLALPGFVGGVGCPSVSEWAMGLPVGWTAL